MEYLSINDRFSLNSHDYLLQTTDDTQAKRVSLLFFRHGELIHTSRLYYDAALLENKRRQLVAQYHQRHKDEVTKLFQLHRQQAELNLETGARYLLACGFLKYGMVYEAVANLEYLVKNQKGTPLVQATLGKAYLKVQKYELALEQLRHAISVHKNYADYHFCCGVCEYYLQRCDAAVGAFSQAIKINPHYGEAYFYLGLALLLNAKLRQKYELAIRLAERTKKIFYNSLAILPSIRCESFDRGIRLLEQENFEEALEAFAPIVANISNDTPDIVNYEFHLTVLHEAEQIRPERVWQEIIRLQDLVQRYSNYPDVYYELGFAYAVLGVSVTSKSLSHYEKALEVNPAFENARKSLKLIRNDQRGFRTMLHAMLRLQR